jgi:hypothetical protein
VCECSRTRLPAVDRSKLHSAGRCRNVPLPSFRRSAPVSFCTSLVRLIVPRPSWSTLSLSLMPAVLTPLPAQRRRGATGVTGMRWLRRRRHRNLRCRRGTPTSRGDISKRLLPCCRHVMPYRVASCRIVSHRVASCRIATPSVLDIACALQRAGHAEAHCANMGCWREVQPHESISAPGQTSSL